MRAYQPPMATSLKENKIKTSPLEKWSFFAVHPVKINGRAQGGR